MYCSQNSSWKNRIQIFLCLFTCLFLQGQKIALTFTNTCFKEYQFCCMKTGARLGETLLHRTVSCQWNLQDFIQQISSVNLSGRLLSSDIVCCLSCSLLSEWNHFERLGLVYWRGMDSGWLLWKDYSIRQGAETSIFFPPPHCSHRQNKQPQDS